ncbi:MAG TPA: hypothetical protein VKA60_17460 [Blastocatellia bacterium]|nr:hypothetical protein [Blastocatellia bacterium]
MEIRFSEIQPKDQLLIHTANSQYRFCVTDAEHRRGRLTGGTLGDNEREAVLAGAINGTGGLGQLAQGLQPGGRAVFYLTATRGVERLITSVITDVACDHRRGDERRAA